MSKTSASNKPAKTGGRSNEARRAETREALLTAAIEVFSEAGFAAGTTKMIADRANVTRGALQYHFESKEDMILAVMDHAMDRINFSLNVAEHLDKSISGRVEVLLDNYRSAFKTPTFLAAIQIFLSVRKEPQLSRRMAERLSASQEAISRTWIDLFPEAAANAEQLKKLRRITMASIRGYVIIEAISSSQNWSEDEIVLRAMLEQNIERLIQANIG